MALNYITLVLDLADGTGTPLATGQALLNPSAQLTNATDDMIVTKAQLSARLAGSYPQVRLLATDNTALRLQDGRGRPLPRDAGEPSAVHVLPPGRPLLFHRDQGAGARARGDATACCRGPRCPPGRFRSGRRRPGRAGSAARDRLDRPGDLLPEVSLPDRSLQQRLDEVALEDEEHQQGRRDDQQRTGAQERGVGPVLPLERRETAGDGALGRVVDQGER
jgi:hypothetical protein